MPLQTLSDLYDRITYATVNGHCVRRDGMVSGICHCKTVPAVITVLQNNGEYLNIYGKNEIDFTWDPYNH